MGRLLACLCLPWLLAVPLLAGPQPPVELLRNGSFAGGMDGWKVNPALPGWNPWFSGEVALHPPSYSFNGMLFYQNLNVAGVSGKTLTVSLSLQNAYALAGNAIAVDLDYATAGGQIKRLEVLNPDNASVPMVYSNVTADFTLPAEASKVVRLSIVKKNNGQFSTTNVSLAGVGLTAGNVPVITSTSTACGYYHSSTNSGLLTITGHDFGAAAGQVLIGTAPAGAVGRSVISPAAQVVSWSVTQAVVSVVEPMRSGSIYLMADSVESDGDLSFGVLSPNFTVDMVNPDITVVRGETASVLLHVAFLNGFQTAGGVSFMLTDPQCTWRASQPLFRSGGYSLDLDTSTLTNGVYSGVAQSLSETYARFTPFTLHVVGITNINFYSSSGSPITSLLVTNQNEFTYTIDYQLVDSTGQPYVSATVGPPQLPPVTVTSDNPGVVMTVAGNFGPRFFAVNDGSANLTFATPDGFSKSLPVTVGITMSPRFLVGSISPGVADNSGLSTNTIYWQGTIYPSWRSYEGNSSFSFDGVVPNPDNHSTSWTFGVPAGTPPGTYLFNSSFDGYSSSANRFVTLTVANVSSRGQIAGQILVVDSGGSYMMQEINGNLELYNDATGAGVVTNNISNFNTSAYNIGYIQPGSYRVRFVPMYSLSGPQWYPNATSFAQAATVTVSAGQTATNINFYLAPIPTPPPNFLLPWPAAHRPGVPGSDWDFGLGTTVSGVTYYLEYKDSLGDAQWTIAQTITGDGGPGILADKAASSPQRFYRLRMVAP